MKLGLLGYIYRWICLVCLLPPYFACSQTVEEIVGQEKNAILKAIPPLDASSHTELQGESHYLVEPFAKNHPFYPDNTWMMGTIHSLSGIFTEQSLKYDLSHDRLVWRNPALPLVPIMLNSSYIKRFSIMGEVFVYLPYQDETSFAGYAHLIWEGPYTLYKKYYTKLLRSGDDPYGAYIQKSFYFMEIDGQPLRINSVKDLKQAIPEKATLIQTYVKKQKLKFRQITPEKFIQLLVYLQNT